GAASRLVACDRDASGDWSVVQPLSDGSADRSRFSTRKVGPQNAAACIDDDEVPAVSRLLGIHRRCVEAPSGEHITDDALDIAIDHWGIGHQRGVGQSAYYHNS